MAWYSWKRGALKPLVIFLAALGIGLFVLGLTLTIIGTRPGYAPYGGNPLKIVGPIMLVLGVLTLMGVIVEWCVRSHRSKSDPEKPVEVSTLPKATFRAQALSKPRPVKDPPIMTSTKNPPSPVFKPKDILPQSQATLARTDSREGVPLPDRPGNYSNGHTPHSDGVTWGSNVSHPYGQKSAHFQPINPQQPVQYTEVLHTNPQRQQAPNRQQSASSGNYFFPTQNNQVYRPPPQQQQQQQQQQQYTGYNPPPRQDSNGNGSNGDNMSGSKLRWGTSKESLDRSQELPVLDIANAGKESSKDKQKGKDKKKNKAGGPGDKYSRSGSYREANKDKPTKSPRATRRPQAEEGRTKHSAENPAYVNERSVDVPSESTPKYRDGHNSSREYQTAQRGGDAAGSNFSRRNSSRTRRGSKRKQHGSRRNDYDSDRDRDRDHNRSRSKERPYRERSNSRGRLGLDDSTTLDYVRGVPIDDNSRKRANRDGNDERRRRHHHRDGDSRKNYESDDSRANYRKRGTPDSTSPSDATRSDGDRQKNKQGYSNGAYENNERALSPRMSAEDFLNSEEVKDAKTTNFTININAQPGSAVQIALGQQNLPTPKPMITATPLKTEVTTRLEQED